jgi:hypothetical protein
MTNMTGSKLSICSHPGKITGYWITTRSIPYRGPSQYGCLFSRCRKYVINSLIHGHFHIGLAIISRPILALDSVSGQYGGLGMMTRPIWRCPCINLYVIIAPIFHMSTHTYSDTLICVYFILKDSVLLFTIWTIKRGHIGHFDCIRTLIFMSYHNVQ